MTHVLGLWRLCEWKFHRSTVPMRHLRYPVSRCGQCGGVPATLHQESKVQLQLGSIFVSLRESYSQVQCFTGWKTAWTCWELLGNLLAAKLGGKLTNCQLKPTETNWMAQVQCFYLGRGSAPLLQAEDQRPFTLDPFQAVYWTVSYWILIILGRFG